METISHKNLKGAYIPQNLKSHKHISRRVKKITEPNKVFVPDSFPGQLKTVDNASFSKSSASDYSTELNQSAEYPTCPDLSIANENIDNRGSFVNKDYAGFSQTSLHEIGSDEQRNNIVDSLVDDALKYAVNENQNKFPAFIRDLVFEVINDAYNGVTIDNYGLLSSSNDGNCDYLSSLSVLGTDESKEDRDADLIPEVEFKEESEPIAAPEEVQEFLEKTFITEPDIEIFESSLADKMKKEQTEKTDESVDNSKIMIVEQYQVDEHEKQMMQKESKLKNLKKDMIKKKEEFKAEMNIKKRDGCCGMQSAGGCNIF